MSSRLAIFLVALVAWFLVVVVRLYDLQVVEHERYAERAVRQQQRVVVLHAPRGTIRDARGRELAVSVEIQSIAADPQEVEDAEETARVLAELLGLGRAQQRELATALDGERRFVWVARKPDPLRAAAVAEHQLAGVFQLPESKRYYPLRTLAAQVLGYVGTDNNGLGGLEAGYDKVIASEPGRRVVVQDGRAAKVVHPNLETAEPQPGSDLRLTLDAAIQQLAEHELEAAIERTNALSGSVVVLDPERGAVLALASYPTFDPNNFGDFPEDHWRNRPLTDAYEPGSTFKAVTLAAALERAGVSLDDVLDCEHGAIRLRGVRIRDHRSFGDLSVRQVLVRSSNIGALKLGFKAGPEALYQTIRAFGFGRKTRIDLPGEHEGLLHPLERWSVLSPAYISFGQGIAVTPIQLATAFAAFANGGRLLQPYVVAEIDGRAVDPGKRRPPTRPVASSTIEQVRSALESVVLEGTGTPAAVAGYRAAGKTGTAEKPIDGRYAKNRYVASFVGFVPVERPALVIAVAIDEPWPNYHGSTAAGPVFRAIAERALLYLGVRPAREPRVIWPGENTRIAVAPEASRDKIAPEASRDRIAPEASRDRIATAATAAMDEDVPEPVPAGTVPDFIGLSKRRSVHAAGPLGLELALHGNGFVVRQQPSPGTPLELAGDTVELWLASSWAEESG